MLKQSHDTKREGIDHNIDYNRKIFLHVTAVRASNTLVTLNNMNDAAPSLI